MRASVPATIRPARPMISISRGDFRVIMSLSKSRPDSIRDLLDGAHGRNVTEQALTLVPLEHRRRLLSVGTQAGGDRGGIVIGSILDIPSAGQAGQDLLIGY